MTRFFKRAVRVSIAGALLAFSAGAVPAAAQSSDSQYLQQNSKRSGVNVTPSGLQYRVLREGTGRRPGRNDEVLVHYEGRLVDGTVFDSSYRRGKPAQFRLNQVIRGWQEGVLLMKEGATYELVIPARLGYGTRGVAEAEIPPNATLIFRVELVRIL